MEDLEQYKTPRDKMRDLEADGIKRPSSLEPLSPEGGVYEFELHRRDTTDRNFEGYLSGHLLPQVLYGFGFPRKKLSADMVIKLEEWLKDFKTIGFKYGDYSWLDDNKITDLISKTKELLGREIKLEGGNPSKYI